MKLMEDKWGHHSLFSRSGRTNFLQATKVQGTREDGGNEASVAFFFFILFVCGDNVYVVCIWWYKYIYALVC